MNSVKFVLYRATENDAVNGVGLFEGDTVVALVCRDANPEDPDLKLNLRLLPDATTEVPYYENISLGALPGQYAVLT